MATLFEYYEKDFGYRLRLSGQLHWDVSTVDISLLIDFEGFYAFLAFYVPDSELDLDHFRRLVSLAGEKRGLSFFGDLKVMLPTAKQVEELKFEHYGEKLRFRVKFFGDMDATWLSTDNMPTSTRLFIYSETDLKQGDIDILKEKAKEFNYNLLFRGEAFRAERSRREVPLAFISYDSKDRTIAQKIASELQNMLCPVWYDEFSLQIGDSVRESIEKGLRECKKCIMILTPNYLENKGWAKTEFNSI